MEQRQRRHTLVWLTALFTGVIIYGSLYPFHFHGGFDLRDELFILSESWQTPPDRYDLVGNILLYLPLGFCVSRSLPRYPFVGGLSAGLGGLILSLPMELLQFYDEGRYPSAWDAFGNTVGALLGATLSVLVRSGKHWPLIGHLFSRPYIALLLVSWSSASLLSSTEVQSRPFGLYVQVAAVLTIALLLEEVTGDRWRRSAILLFAMAFLLGRMLINRAIPSIVELESNTIGVLLWSALLWRSSIRRSVVALIYVASVATERLQPFKFIASWHTLQLVPLYGLIMAPPEAAILITLNDLFSLGALTWLLVRAGFRWRFAVFSSSLIVALLLLTACLSPGKEAEISDLLILAGLACVMKLAGEDKALVGGMQPY